MFHFEEASMGAERIGLGEALLDTASRLWSIAGRVVRHRSLAARQGSMAALGERGERVAARWLAAHGMPTLWRNIVLPQGEVDLICMERTSGMIVLVEVKSRVPVAGQPAPEAMVDGAKRAKLKALASHLISANRWNASEVRIDVIGIDFPAAAEPLVRHYREVVSLDPPRRAPSRAR